MNKLAKIHLSKWEMNLVKNTEWIFTKRKIMEKAHLLLGRLHADYRQIIESELEYLPDNFIMAGGKISRGENYKGLPFLILDYPAMFSKENIFAIRTMFWWGNFFSVSIHISGKKFCNTKNITKWIGFFKQKRFFISTSESQWEHTFDAYNFVDINELDEVQLQNISQKDFFKIAKKVKLNQWNDAPQMLEEYFKEIIEFIKINFHQGDEKGLLPGFAKAGSDL